MAQLQLLSAFTYWSWVTNALVIALTRAKAFVLARGSDVALSALPANALTLYATILPRLPAVAVTEFSFTRLAAVLSLFAAVLASEDLAEVVAIAIQWASF